MGSLALIADLFVVAVLVLWIPTAVYTGWVAGEKGYSMGWWVIGGLCFGIVALLAAGGDAGEEPRSLVKPLVALAVAVLAACQSSPAEPVRPVLPEPPEPRIIADHEFVAVTGIPQGGPFGAALEGDYDLGYRPFRWRNCSGAPGDPDCEDAVDARLSYLWEDGSDFGDLLVRVTRHTYPSLSDQPRWDLSSRPGLKYETRNITGLPGAWYIIWRDTAQVEHAPLRQFWRIAGKWRTDSVTIEVAEDRLPRKVGTREPGREFPEPWTAADGTRYHHPAESELAAYGRTVMRADLGDFPRRYGLRCGRGVRPVCARIDPVVVATVHGGGEVTLDGRWWKTGSSTTMAVRRTARPDDRGHAIFRSLVEDDYTGGLPRFTGQVRVLCDSGASLEAEVGELYRSGGNRKPGAVTALAWVFADCPSGTVTTMRDRYPDIPR